MVGNVVRNLDGEASVDLKSPDLAIIVEVSIFPMVLQLACTESLVCFS